MNVRLFFAIGLIFLLFSNCNVNKVHPVPSVPFDVIVDINLPLYNNLLGVGGYAIVNNAGYNGVVVYRRNLNEFVAFDLQSPAEDGTCTTPLAINEDNFLQLDDLCSGATFSLYDGSPMSGSKFGLRMYICYYDGIRNLRIYN